MSSSQSDSIVISGVGVISTLGSDVQTFWNNLCSGMSGYGPVQLLKDEGRPFEVAGCIESFSLTSQNDTEQSRATQLAQAAAAQAIAQAGLGNLSSQQRQTVGVVMGSTCGANDQLEVEDFDQHWFSGNSDKCSSEQFRRYDHSAIANAISRQYGFQGPSYVVGTACASGNHAIGDAFNMIKAGQADVVIAGGADAFTLLPVFGFYAMKSLAPRECRPFDRHREGMILGEGAAALVVETESSARERGVTPIARLSAWALNCDAVNFAAPLDSGERCAELVTECLRAGGVEKSDIDYVNAHGTGTATNDLMEGRGLGLVFGEAPVLVSSVKGSLGHTLGASGAIEGAISTLAVAHGRIPPNSPVNALDEGISIEIPQQSLDKPLKHVLSLSFAFGGCNVATLFSRM